MRSATVRIHGHGGPEVLKFEDVNVPASGPGEVRVQQSVMLALLSGQVQQGPAVRG